MKTYPIMLDVRRKLAVVIGAGGVGRRKVRSLRAAGADVTLVDPEMPDGLDLQGAELLTEPYDPAQLEGAYIVFACTDDRELNSRIAADARHAGAIVNVADQNEDCDFFAPATIGDGDVVVAIGTGGASPALAAFLKDRLRGALPEQIGQFADLLATLRGELKDLLDDTVARGEILRQLVSDETIEAFAAEGPAAVRLKLADILEAAQETDSS